MKALKVLLILTIAGSSTLSSMRLTQRNVAIAAVTCIVAAAVVLEGILPEGDSKNDQQSNTDKIILPCLGEIVDINSNPYGFYPSIRAKLTQDYEVLILLRKNDDFATYIISKEEGSVRKEVLRLEMSSHECVRGRELPVSYDDRYRFVADFVRNKSLKGIFSCYGVPAAVTYRGKRYTSSAVKMKILSCKSLEEILLYLDQDASAEEEASRQQVDDYIRKSKERSAGRRNHDYFKKTEEQGIRRQHHEYLSKYNNASVQKRKNNNGR